MVRCNRVKGGNKNTMGKKKKKEEDGDEDMGGGKMYLRDRCYLV